MELRKAPLRPYMSPSLPQMGVEAAVARVYAVTTQDRWAMPPRSPTMVGIAVPTIMLSSIARSIAIIRAISTTRVLRCFGPASGAPAAPASG